MTKTDLDRLEEFISSDIIIPLKSVGSEISRGASRTTSQTFGTIPSLLRSANLSVQTGGRYLVDGDLERRAPVAVIGSEIAKLFFPLSDPVGQTFALIQESFQLSES